MRCPVVILRVATPVPSTAGMPYSRATIELWLSGPPTSVTTPAWTSLFAMASAVVTDIGGPLSHSSIVAREYGIPAVLGTAVATRRIPDGARVRVDGDAGTVTLL